jgi:hypothetical protein
MYENFVSIWEQSVAESILTQEIENKNRLGKTAHYGVPKLVHLAAIILCSKQGHEMSTNGREEEFIQLFGRTP